MLATCYRRDRARAALDRFQWIRHSYVGVLEFRSVLVEGHALGKSERAGSILSTGRMGKEDTALEVQKSIQGQSQVGGGECEKRSGHRGREGTMPGQGSGAWTPTAGHPRHCVLHSKAGARH